MTEQKKQNDQQARPEAESETETPDTAEQDSAPAEDAASARRRGEDVGGEDGGQDPLEVLREEAASLRDQLLRALAEVENTRRRAQKDKQEAARYAPAPLARDLLAVSPARSVPEELAKDEREPAASR